MTGSRYFRILQWALLLCVLAALTVIITRYRSQLAALSWRPSSLFPFLLVSLSCILLRALLVGELAAYFNVNLRFGEMLGLTIVSTTLSEILPASAGTLIKPAYLSRVYRLNLSATIVMIITNSVVITLVSSALAIIGLIAAGWGLSALTASFATLLLLCTMAFFISPRTLSKWCWPSFQRTFDAWQQIQSNPRRSCRVLALAAVLCTFDALQLWLAFEVIGADLSFDAALVLSGVGLLIGYLSIVPGGLGLIEAAVAGVSVLLGYAALHALAATLVFRAGILIFSVPATPIFYLRLMKSMSRPPSP